MALWNWNGKWTASEWGNGNSPLPWRYNHIRQVNRGDTTFTLDASGAPQLQAQNGTAAAANGLWETEVTLPKLKDGLIVAPLWVYDPASRDEIDFEFAGRKGLDVSLHAAVQGVMKVSTVRLYPGVDMSGQRKRFGIKVDQTSGFVEMYVDRVLVYRWNRSTMSFFVSKPLKPWIEMWPAITSNAGFVSWAGKWQGLAANETLSMVVHGYGYTPLR
ncbi:family 16 glycosylhydrolase [Sphingomonas sp. RB3P16]|uniref:family 16 glycosylhydrolase n=1 Tax=Parasphingomonas frigoris TaxID=3096163 RepID=UPI002FC70F1F